MNKERAEHLEKLLYTTTPPNCNVHRCVVVFGEKHAVSYQHGSHSTFVKGDELVLYNVKNMELTIPVVVGAVSVKNDYIIFETTGKEFPDLPEGTDSLYCGQKYYQLGLNYDRTPRWSLGVISRRNRYGVYFGSSHGQVGDSGSGLFDVYGNFIGIMTSKKVFTFTTEKENPGKPVINFEEVADHHPEPKFVNADIILRDKDIKELDFMPPASKRSAADD